MTLQEYSEQNPGNLKLYKTNNLASSTNKLQGRREREIQGEPKRNLARYKPIPLYGLFGSQFEQTNYKQIFMRQGNFNTDWTVDDIKDLL